MSDLPTAKDMQPLESALDPAFPERLRDIATCLYVEIIGNAVTAKLKREELAALAIAQTIRMSAELGGHSFYMHKAISFRLTPRNRQMCSEFRGDYIALARKYKLTDQQVRNIVNAWQEQEFLKKQNPLFDDTPAQQMQGRKKAGK